MVAAQTPDSVATAGSARARDNRWQITLHNDSLVWDVRLVGLSEDRLMYRAQDSTGAVKVNDIDDIRLFRSSEMQMGTAGGAFGALSGSDDIVFDMRTMDFAAKMRVVQQLLEKYPPDTGQ
jgi:hypothetical protein